MIKLLACQHDILIETLVLKRTVLEPSGFNHFLEINDPVPHQYSISTENGQTLFFVFFCFVFYFMLLLVLSYCGLNS